MRPPRLTIRSSLYATGAFALGWPLLVFALGWIGWSATRATAARAGLGAAFFIGLAWVVWYVERASRRIVEERRGRRKQSPAGPAHTPVRIWDPRDPEAWYYGRRSQKLAQSLATLFSYSLAFFVAAMMATALGGCREIYEMPAGGGEQKTIAQTVKIQKVIKKKYVINPFSLISFNPPPIDEIKLQLLEITSHQYTVGYGQGSGAGYAGGTRQGKVRFIRLEYAGGDWDQDFGVGGDLNLLVEYGQRTGQPVNGVTESRSVGQLANFPIGKSPPMVYLTGQKSISLSKSEIKTLREYLVEKHGMLFGDNGGSGHFHNQFVAMMQQALPNVEPVRVPLDDVIHRVPYQLPFLPYVSPHAGKEALGWKVDGRWVCYYHPGDIGDAWNDDHSGVEPEIYEFCYQLGTNVINYAHAEYSKWLEGRQAK